MLAAVVCFVSVLCTTSLASFGMDAAAIVRATVGSSSSSHGEGGYDDEDIVRISDSRCVLFHEFFAAVAILVAILYYAIVKLSLVAMGAVIMRPPNPHPLYDNDDGDSDSVGSARCRQHKDGGKRDDENSDGAHESTSSSSSISSLSTSSDSSFDDDAGTLIHDSTHNDDAEFGPYLEPADSASARAAAAAEGETGPSYAKDVLVAQIEMRDAQQDGCEKTQLLESAAAAGPAERPRHVPSSDEIEEDCRRTIRQSRSHNNPMQRSERFNAVKIWTNIYGLSIGIYCLVYSLLLPNELSAYVFCVASLLAGVHETLIPCIRQYLLDEEYEMVGNSAEKTRRPMLSGRKALVKRQFKRCLGWLCLFQSSMTSEISEAVTQSIRDSRVHRRAKRRRDALLQAAPGRRRCCLPRFLLCVIPCCRDACLDLRDCVLCCLCPCKAGWVKRRRLSSSSSLIRSGVLAMPSIILLMAAGLTCKALQDVYFKDAMLHEIEASSRFSHGMRYYYNYRQWLRADEVAVLTGNETAKNVGMDTSDIMDNISSDASGIVYAHDSMFATNNDNGSTTPSDSKLDTVPFTMISPEPKPDTAPTTTIEPDTIPTTINDDPVLEPTPTTKIGTSHADSHKSNVYGFTDAASIAVNILFPIIGVLMLKSMRKAESVRETIELTVPVCGLNSLCIACIIMIQAPACLMRHLSSTIIELGGGIGSSSGAAAAAFYDAAAAGNTNVTEGVVGGENVLAHSAAETPMVLMRYQPILAALVLPFPLVCSIVCIVSAGRNHRFMVSGVWIMHVLVAWSIFNVGT